MLHRVILPTATRGVVAQPRPVVVVVAGQPGAGKTRRGRRRSPTSCRPPWTSAAVPCGSAGTCTSPRTGTTRASRPPTSVRPESRSAPTPRAGWQLSKPVSVTGVSTPCRRSPTRTISVAPPLPTGRQSTGSRWWWPPRRPSANWASWIVSSARPSMAGAGTCRENHDTCAQGLLGTLAVIEAEQFADRVTVVRRTAPCCTPTSSPQGAAGGAV